MKLSIVISVFNEEKMLPDCLESVKDLGDEIIVVDNSSTDDTSEIARKFTDKVYTQKNDPSAVDLQKNLGFEKASGEWILNIDADERVTPELAKEIKQILSSDPAGGTIRNKEVTGYWIPRKNILFGKWIQHTGWYPDEQLRLFKNGKGKYVKKHVHEDLMLVGNAGYLQQPLVHENYQSISQFITRNMLKYAPNEAESILEKGYTFSYLDAIRMPLSEFLSRYFAREGYKDGLHGLVLSLLLAAYHLTIFGYIWEKKGFVQENNEYALSGVEKEIKKSGRDFAYWLSNEKLKNEKNVFKKVFLKTKRKLS